MYYSQLRYETKLPIKRKENYGVGLAVSIEIINVEWRV